MLWLKVKIGEAVYVDGEPLVLEFKDAYGVVIAFRGAKCRVKRNCYADFGSFRLHTGDRLRGLRLGFEAPAHVRIRRAKLED